MSKKEYLLTILNALIGSWPIAKDLKLLIERDKLNEDAINTLVKVFQESVQTISQKIGSKKLDENMDNVEKIKEQEEKNQAKDQISVSRLDNLIRYL